MPKFTPIHFTIHSDRTATYFRRGLPFIHVGVNGVNDLQREFYGDCAARSINPVSLIEIRS